MNRQIILKNRPAGMPQVSDFAVVESPVPEPADGEILCRTIYLSLDPYMRGRMSEAKSYARPAALGQVMVGGTVSEVVASKHPSYTAGDIVNGYDGWQEYAVSKGGARKLDPQAAPISTALGVLGMPGQTACVGLLDIGRPQPGETVVVSAAAGAVGSVVGQIAKIKGCRAVGVAGSPAKCEYVVHELGFDACVRHKEEELIPALKAACPQGIDIYFDNVGGAVLDAVLHAVNAFARIPLCGVISEYNDTEPAPGPNMRRVLVNRVMIQGFIVSDYADRLGEHTRALTGWFREGKLKYREDVVDGLENAPQAFIGLFEGRNFGKLLVRVSAEPETTSR
jgi:NADPH-dependent curcumin reductase CurA